MLRPIELGIALIGLLCLVISGCQSRDNRNDEIDSEEIGSLHNVNALPDKARISEAQGDPDGVIAEYTRAIQAAPKSVELFVARAKAYEKAAQLNRAIADWDQAIWLGRGNWEHYRERARLYMRMELYSEAVSDLSLAISANPHCQELYNDRALAYQKLGKPSMADDDFQKAGSKTATPVGSHGPSPAAQH